MSPPTPKTASRRTRTTTFIVLAAAAAIIYRKQLSSTLVSLLESSPTLQTAAQTLLQTLAANKKSILAALLFTSTSAMGIGILKEAIAGTHKKLVRGPEDLDVDGEYDYIIVGGGTAGCVLAARLSEDPSLKILVLESGGSGRAVPMTRIPVGAGLLFGSKHLYNFYTEPQPNANGVKKYWPRARLLGGCSSINAQMAQYGAPGDFDEWAAIAKDDAWKWENFRRYFSKFESFVPDANPIIPPSAPDATKANIDSIKKKDYGGEAKNTKGPVRVGYHSYMTAGGRAFVQSCVNEGIEYSPDFNGTEGTRGVNRIMTYIDEKRTRVSSETAYFTDEVLARPNLTVVLQSTVTKILTKKGADGQLKATGVEIGDTRKTKSEQRGTKGKRWTVKAKREVIVTAGAIHSPHILLLSGIGPTSVLSSVTPAIPTVHDLPGVGKNLVDHPVVDIYYKNAKNDSPTYLKPKGPIDLFKLLKAAVSYLRDGDGPLASNIGEAAAFIRSDDPKLFPELATAVDQGHQAPVEALRDSTSAPDSPDLELFLTPFAYKDHARYMFPMATYGIHVCLLRPLSKGTLTLRTSNPFDAPLMDPNYLSAREDIAKLIRGIRLIQKIGRAEPLDKLLDHTNRDALLDHQMHLKTDAELEALVRERVETLYHPAGTCRMAPLDQDGVVDSHLRVHGVQGLRVCDASIFPEIVSGHTAGACLASGEHLADIIKSELADA